MKALTLLFIACQLAPAYGQNLSISSKNGSTRTVYNRGGISSFNVETRGKFEVTDDDKDIKSMSPDGYLEINKTVFGSKRTIVVTPQGSGLKKEYYEGRTLVPFEPEGRKWLGEILPEIVRSTTIAAEGRVNRFYRQGGSKAVIDEIRIIESDYVKVHYANILMSLPLPATEFGAIASQVAESMDSDHYITEFLTKNMVKFLQSREATEAVFTATRNMDSDHYKTEVIKEALERGPASLENVKIALQATGEMDSDHYKTEVLTSLLKQSNLTDAIISEMVNTTKLMESDHYKTVVLKKALAKPGLSSVSFQRTLESVKNMSSDHYRTEVLTSLLQNNLPVDVQTILVLATSSIDSDHYMNVVGKKILQTQTLSDDAFQNLLEVMNAHKSDYYASEFLRAASEIPNLSKRNMLAILNGTGSIDSDHYVTEVLTDMAPIIKLTNDPALKEAYRAAAKKIGSETYYGRAMRAID